MPSFRLDVPTRVSCGVRVEVLPAIDPAVAIGIRLATQRPIAVEIRPLIDPSRRRFDRRSSGSAAREYVS